MWILTLVLSVNIYHSVYVMSILKHALYLKTYAQLFSHSSICSSSTHLGLFISFSFTLNTFRNKIQCTTISQLTIGNGSVRECQNEPFKNVETWIELNRTMTPLNRIVNFFQTVKTPVSVIDLGQFLKFKDVPKMWE